MVKLTLIEGFEVCALIDFFSNSSKIVFAKVFIWLAEVEEYCRQKQGPYMEDKVSSTCKVELTDTRESTVSGNSKSKIMLNKTKMINLFWRMFGWLFSLWDGLYLLSIHHLIIFS